MFRRDLRLQDNTALNAALRASEVVLPCFIFAPEQTGPHPYRSETGLRFMCSALKDLDRHLRDLGSGLQVLEGHPAEVLEALILNEKLDAVYVNLDYTAYSRRRDNEIAEVCGRHGVRFEQAEDALLTTLSAGRKPDGHPYTVFTPFHKRVSRNCPLRPEILASGGLAPVKSVLDLDVITRSLLSSGLGASVQLGGRAEALAILREAPRFGNYESVRNIPADNATTLLSVHNKFGTVSIREVYHSLSGSLGSGHPLLRQLYWRDFFSLIAFHFPHVFGGAFRAEYDALQWEDNEEGFSRWCQGETGFPIVDAGMRQLNATGFMHNRVRMIAGSFLVKDLHIDWRRGEEYFATRLVDYDPAVNNGNWQWVASTGCDAQPYFRIFNPWLQQKRFDPACLYIKHWIPELEGISPASIHRVPEDGGRLCAGYPVPVVLHDEEKILAEEMFLAGRL